MICSSCQHQLSDEAQFCGSCGTQTGEVAMRSTIKNSPETTAGDNDPGMGSQPDSRIGLILDSKYQLVERLGQGGMGAVYRARRLHIGDDVAVKLLSHDLIRERQAVERFRREARSAALIRHPNVVSIHDFNDQSDVGGASEAYIVMELVHGESLRHLLEREGHLTTERSVSIMLDICAGVGAAHRRGLLHRDLKPDNVIVTPPTHAGEHETAKVVDFGLAKVRDDVTPLTQTGTLLGTAYYMSPEQCRGDDLDARSDVYSLGAMLYEMLSGHPPFVANNVIGLITKHLNEPPAILPYSLGIPAALGDVCFRALAKNRDERQADALVFSNELKQALSGSADEGVIPAQVAAYQELPAGKVKQTHGSWLKWAVITLPVLLLLTTAVGLFLWFVVISPRFYNAETAAQTQPADPTTVTHESSNDDMSPATASVTDLRGRWTGTYGPMGIPTTLVINNHQGEKIQGVLEQGGIRVLFEGTVQSNTVRMTQTAVISGDGWSLGEDVGTITRDGKRMSGTGKDAMGSTLGLTYQWTFTR